MPSLYYNTYNITGHKIEKEEEEGEREYCRRNRYPLPEKLIVGYANWDQCDDKVRALLLTVIVYVHSLYLT